MKTQAKPSSEILSHSEGETGETARKIASDLRAGDLVYLHGDLGAGKSVFARALIRELADDPELDVPSPTFTLVQTYDTQRGPLFHFDLYRIEDEEEIFELDWEDALHEGIVLVEWPEKLGCYQAAPALDIRIAASDNGPDSRTITIERYDDRT